MQVMPQQLKGGIKHRQMSEVHLTIQMEIDHAHSFPRLFCCSKAGQIEVLRPVDAQTLRGHYAHTWGLPLGICESLPGALYPNDSLPVI